MKTKEPKKEVYFIATRYQKEPVDVSFYTKDGRKVAFESVEKKRTKQGVRFFATAK